MEKIDLGNISLGNSTGSYQCDSSPARNAAVSASQIENDYYYDACEDTKVCNVGDAVLEHQGRILDLSMTLKNVCPGKRVAVGITLTEVDSNQNEYPRGLKTITVPAHNQSYCIDIPLSSMRFILPEDISVGGSAGICNSQRHFIARVDAHYIDMNSGDCGSSCNCSAR